MDGEDAASAYEDSNLELHFKRAENHVKYTLGRLTSQHNLQLDALYQQGSQGPCNQPKPRSSHEVIRWTAWNALGWMSKEMAQQAYIGLVKSLDPKFVVNRRQFRGHVVDSKKKQPSTSDSACGPDDSPGTHPHPKPMAINVSCYDDEDHHGDTCAGVYVKKQVASAATGGPGGAKGGIAGGFPGTAGGVSPQHQGTKHSHDGDGWPSQIDPFWNQNRDVPDVLGCKSALKRLTDNDFEQTTDGQNGPPTDDQIAAWEWSDHPPPPSRYTQVVARPRTLSTISDKSYLSSSEYEQLPPKSPQSPQSPQSPDSFVMSIASPTSTMSGGASADSESSLTPKSPLSPFLSSPHSPNSPMDALPKSPSGQNKVRSVAVPTRKTKKASQFEDLTMLPPTTEIFALAISPPVVEYTAPTKPSVTVHHTAIGNRTASELPIGPKTPTHYTHFAFPTLPTKPTNQPIGKGITIKPTEPPARRSSFDSVPVPKQLSVPKSPSSRRKSTGNAHHNADSRSVAGSTSSRRSSRSTTRPRGGPPPQIIMLGR